MVKKEKQRQLENKVSGFGNAGWEAEIKNLPEKQVFDLSIWPIMIIYGPSTKKASEIIPGLSNYFEVCIEISAGNITCSCLLSVTVKKLQICIIATSVHFSCTKFYTT